MPLNISMDFGPITLCLTRFQGLTVNMREMLLLEQLMNITRRRALGKCICIMIENHSYDSFIDTVASCAHYMFRTFTRTAIFQLRNMGNVGYLMKGSSINYVPMYM